MRNRFETLHIVLNFLGALLLVLSLFLLLPLVVGVLSGELNHGFLGAIPFVLGIGSSYIDGYFETMSGFTTTGITMYTGLDSMPRSIIFWRSLTQFIGGLGILTFFLAVSYRGGSAHTLFGAESHKIEVERPVPGLGNTIKVLWGIYFLFTLAVAAALTLAGMPLFESVCHSFTALSTGGFSPFDASIAQYRIVAHPHFVLIEYILFIGIYKEETGDFHIPRGSNTLSEGDTVFLASKSQFIKKATDYLTETKK